MTTFAEQYEVFKNNVNSAMSEDLAEKLGVTAEAINKLGIGFHFGEQAWIFAERDAKGDIIGLSKRRNENEFKYMAEGSKRGLLYAYNADYSIGDKKYEAGKCHWIRIADAGVVCPVCGKPDWCMVSSDDPKNPSAVLCSRIRDGARQEISGSGWLHILDHGRQNAKASNTVLDKTELPTIIVEGASDVLAAMSLGFVAIGRPSAQGGMGFLKEMPLAGREIWIIGDNDAGAGREGVQKTYLNIKSITENIHCVFPPEGIKDLRQWLQRGLTQELLFEHVGSHSDGSIAIDPNVFPEDTAYVITKKFLGDNYITDNDISLLRNFHDQWVRWIGCRYEDVDMVTLRGELYRYLEGKYYVKYGAKGIDIVPYKPTRSKINDILDAMNGWCPITVSPPAWLDTEEHIHPSNLIIFKNGMLDIKEYCKGNIKLHDPDPRLFTYNVIPYAFDPKVWSNRFEDTYNQWMDEDEERIRLLAQWYGYNLVSDMSQEKLMIFVGPTRGGKGTACEVLQGIIGRNQYCSTSFQALSSPYGLSNLVGKLAAILGDAKTPRKSEADTALENILRIVGRDYITINPKYVTPYDIYPTCRFTIAMNNLPKFSDAAQAFVARSNILGFFNSYAGKEDTSLKTRLNKEAVEGKMINFALWGLKDLRKQGRFVIPGTSKALIRQLQEIVAPVLSFTEECCITGDEHYILRTTLFEAWEHWCNRGHYNSTNINHFGHELKQAVPGVQDFRPTVDNRRQWAYKGIMLQPWVEKEFLGKPN